MSEEQTTYRHWTERVVHIEVVNDVVIYELEPRIDHIKAERSWQKDYVDFRFLFFAPDPACKNLEEIVWYKTPSARLDLSTHQNFMVLDVAHGRWFDHDVPQLAQYAALMVYAQKRWNELREEYPEIKETYYE